MKSDDFEWDDAKAAGNHRRHKITFEQAREVFADPFIIEWVDKGQDEHEQRLSAIGMVENRLLFVAYTMRGDTIRVISARRADRLNDGGIMKRIKHDWKEADALTDAEIHAAALADPDAQPLTPERLRVRVGQSGGVNFRVGQRIGFLPIMFDSLHDTSIVQTVRPPR